MAKARLRRKRRELDTEGMIRAGRRGHRPVVYGYRFPSRPGLIKIGYSSRGLERVREQSTSFPERPQVLFVIHHPQAKDLEAALHQALADRQAHGVMGVEWFHVSLEEVILASP
jgi:hypothetical protein